MSPATYPCTCLTIGQNLAKMWAGEDVQILSRLRQTHKQKSRHIRQIKHRNVRTRAEIRSLFAVTKCVSTRRGQVKVTGHRSVAINRIFESVLTLAGRKYDHRRRKSTIQLCIKFDLKYYSVVFISLCICNFYKAKVKRLSIWYSNGINVCTSTHKTQM